MQWSRIYAEGEHNTVTIAKQIYQKDHLGSVRDVADAVTGAHLNSFDYSPFGRQLSGTTGVQPFFKFAGMCQDRLSAIYFTKTRAYDAITGNFLSRDTVEEGGGVNLYQYAAWNPISRVDPNGTSPFALPLICALGGCEAAAGVGAGAAALFVTSAAAVAGGIEWCWQKLHQDDDVIL